MAIEINHLSYRVTEKPDIEFVFLNLIFSVSKDDDYRLSFENLSNDPVKRKAFLSREPLDQNDFETAYSPENLIDVYVNEDSMIQYLPKFNKFRFCEYFGWYETVKGAIKDLENLKMGINKSRTTDSCLFYSILRSLEYHWD